MGLANVGMSLNYGIFILIRRLTLLVSSNTKVVEPGFTKFHFVSGKLPDLIC